MKLGTLVKIGALAAATASTAVGTIMVTTKALKKVGGDEAPASTPAPAPAPAPAPVVEAPAFVAAPEPVPAPAFEAAPTPVAIPVVEEPVVEPVAEPAAPVVEEIPVAAPVIEEPQEVFIPQEFAAPATVVVAPVEAELPNIEAPVEEAPAYVDFAMNLPYAAATAGNNEDIVIGGATPVVEEAPAAAPVLDIPAPVVEEPVVEVVEEVPVIEEAPVVEEAPIVEETFVEPEVVLSVHDTIADEPTDEPVLPTAEPVEEVDPIAGINPLEQGFSVSITEDAGAEALPSVGEVPAIEAFAEPALEEAPVTFESLEVAAPVEADPVVEIEPVVEPEPVDAPIEEAPMGNVKNIGDSVVSDDPTNVNIKAVADAFNVPAKNLVSIAAEGQMPMVFEFLYDDMRTDASLMAVYFIVDGKAILPPETEKETVLATGRNFITGNEELKAFLTK